MDPIKQDQKEFGVNFREINLHSNAHTTPTKMELQRSKSSTARLNSKYCNSQIGMFQPKLPRKLLRSSLIHYHFLEGQLQFVH